MTKKAEKEKYKFAIPDFDEKEYIRKEFADVKQSLLVLGYAVLFALISLLLHKISFVAAVAVGLLGIFGIRFLFLGVKIDISKLDKKAWLSHSFVYLITWLIFWSVFSNV
ncbi:MAG: hypothetical protein QME47_06960 [Candidatus Thermoplasmatota archaeon]|nr:hypothetical protein [Candidatus Thermoplasmatota archaeon]